MASHVWVFISFEHTDLEQKDHLRSANNSKIRIIMTQCYDYTCLLNILKLQHLDQYYILYKDLPQPFLSVCLL